MTKKKIRMPNLAHPINRRRALRALAYCRTLPASEPVAISNAERQAGLGHSHKGTGPYFHSLLTCVANGVPRLRQHKQYVVNWPAVNELEREIARVDSVLADDWDGTYDSAEEHEQWMRAQERDAK